MFIYYVLETKTNNIRYFEMEEEQTKDDFDSMFYHYDKEIIVYDSCTNVGLFGEVYRNF